MKIITIAAAKGGVGKTSLTAALAVAANLDMPDIRVGIADLDPQGSLTLWWNCRGQPRPHLCNLAGLALADALPGVRAAGFDLLFVDCPPSFSAILRHAIGVADLVLVPAQASDVDLAAIASTVEMAQRAGIPYRTVLNRPVFRTRIAGSAVRTLRERGGMLWPPLHQRVQVPAAMASGLTAMETQPGGAAAREMGELWRGVRAMLDDTPERPHLDQARRPKLAIAPGGSHDRRPAGTRRAAEQQGRGGAAPRAGDPHAPQAGRAPHRRDPTDRDLRRIQGVRRAARVDGGAGNRGRDRAAAARLLITDRLADEPLDCIPLIPPLVVMPFFAPL